MENISLPCPICKKGFENIADCWSTLTDKGCQSILEASIQLNDNITVLPGSRIHKNCRKKYTHPSTLRKCLFGSPEDPPILTSTPKLRSHEVFAFRDHCILCAQPATLSGRKRGIDVFPVRTSDFQDQMLAHCQERNDDWAMQVKGRIQSVNDLHAADALYHQTCSVNFRTKKEIPKAFALSTTVTPKVGRRSKQAENFQKIIDYLEERLDQQVTVVELVQKMKEMSNDDDGFSDTHMRRKLQEHYGDSIMFTSQFQKSNIITIREAMSTILKQFHQRYMNLDEEEEKKSIIDAAAKIIRHDIMGMSVKADVYPSSEDIGSAERNLSYIPDTLRYFLKKTIQRKDIDQLKVSSIGQAITQNTRPRHLLSPLQLGLGLQVHHQFGSRSLVNTLYALGFCVSYHELQRFESNAACKQNTDIPGFTDEAFLQYSADNVDHNSCTLDGKGTFHGMGIIATITPGKKTNYSIPRLSGSQVEMKKSGSIELKFYQSPSNKFNTSTFSQLPEIRRIDTLRRFDYIPSILWPLRNPMPGWSGTMQMCQKGTYPGKSSITFLPMINMNPSDLSCIYTTLSFVANHAGRYRSTPIITFDQPLFWKAHVMIANEPADSPLSSVVLRLGGFHTEMSFLGSIGHLMKGSGLHEVLEEVYAANAVDHIMSGKAVSRAIRAHCLMDTSLHSLLIPGLFNLQLPEENEEQFPLYNDPLHRPDDETLLAEHRDANNTANARALLDEINKMFDLVVSGEMSVEEFSNHYALENMEKEILRTRKSLKDHRTAKLWMEYMEMIAILKSFLRAERTGNWHLHLQSVCAMLPYFAATGHNLYLKSAYVYVVKMAQLENTNPDVYAMFTAGHHVLRRTDRFWAGLSSDLIIEQVLMRSLKTAGGLTRGRGMTDNQRAKWVQSMPVCAEINNEMQNITDVTFCTNEQHKEQTTARQKRDSDDINLLLKFLGDRNPFNFDEKSLRNIETGVVAEKGVNPDDISSVGDTIITSMKEQKIHDFTFRKAHQIKTMDSRVGVKIENDIVQVDPQLLFQRLIAAARMLTGCKTSSLFSYELSCVPSSLFNDNGLPREANKPQLADAIWKMGICGVDELPSTLLYVIDGGSLLQRIPWTKGDTFSEIIQNYLDYVHKRYTDVIIVFDGYANQDKSSKGITHLRRSKIVSQRVHFTEDMPCRIKKETFLSNSENKQDFLKMLGEKFTAIGVENKHAEGDADKLIALTGVERCTSKDVVVIGEDTDLLVLLLYHADINSVSKLFFKSDNSKGKTRIWDIKKTKGLLGEQLSKVLPVVHSLTGCDTTSRMFGVGKAAALKKIASSPQLLSACSIFLRDNVSEAELTSSGNELIQALYGGRSDSDSEDLDSLRFRRFSQKTATSTTSVHIQTLPPTKDAATFHTKRVYLQIQEWIHTQCSLQPEEWGWHMKDERLVPIRSSQPAAPEHLLKVIRCSCKQGCETKRCACRKHGLDCSMSCSECRGVSCSNSMPMDEIETE